MSWGQDEDPPRTWGEQEAQEAWIGLVVRREAAARLINKALERAAVEAEQQAMGYGDIPADVLRDIPARIRALKAK